MYKLAVVGNPIAHSLSPKIHQAFAKQCGVDVQYEKVLAPLDGFTKTVEGFFAQGGAGLNITVPFKQEAYALCQDKLSSRAKAAGAVNTLYTKDNSLFGDNTDGQGLVNAITDLGWMLQGTKVAIVGAGGAARGVVLPLLHAGTGSITIANRTLSKAEALISDLSPYLTEDKLTSVSIEALSGEYDLIINATSASLSGTALAFCSQLQTNNAYDMVYVKSGEPTPFMWHFKEQGSKVADGLGMLIGQAAVSFEIWTGKKPDLANIDWSFLRC